jgi:hypothetical protein
VSAEHDIPDDDNQRPKDAEVDVVAEAEESFEQSRHRPPDLVGTRPEWDPATLVPTETPRAAAGRLWAPAGEGVSDTETLAADATAAATTQAAEEAAAPIEVVVPPYSRYSARFQFLFGALIAIGATAVVLLVAVVVGGKNDNISTLPAGPPWSRWEPTTKGVLGANEIADHVGREYRVGGKQLATVTGSALELHGLPVTIAVLQTAAQGGDIDILDGTGVLYRLCGVYADNCNLAGKPSQARLLLLRREALELALYSFKYLGVSKAVVILPPTGPAALDPVTGKLTKAKTTPARALLFRNDEPDVQSAIIHPLATTLVAKKTPTVASVSRSPDAQNVSALTIGKLFSSKFTTANQDAGFILVLDPVPLG